VEFFAVLFRRKDCCTLRVTLPDMFMLLFHYAPRDHIRQKSLKRRRPFFLPKNKLALSKHPILMQILADSLLPSNLLKIKEMLQKRKKLFISNGLPRLVMRWSFS